MLQFFSFGSPGLLLLLILVAVPQITTLTHFCWFFGGSKINTFVFVEIMVIKQCFKFEHSGVLFECLEITPF